MPKWSSIFLMVLFISLFTFSGFLSARDSERDLIPLVDGGEWPYYYNYLLKTPVPGAFRGVIESPYDNIIGYTWCDYQHNNTMPKMIVNDYQAINEQNGIHCTWMSYDSDYFTSERYICFQYKNPSTNSFYNDPYIYTQSDKRAGFSGIDCFCDNREVLIFHYFGPGSFPYQTPLRSTIQIERTAPGFNDVNEFDIPDCCEGVDPWEGWHIGGMWPHGGIDGCGDIHILVKNGMDSRISGLGYTRCNYDQVNNILTCISPGIDTVVLDGGIVYPDSNLVTKLDLTDPASYIVACDPDSEKVALIWTKWTQTWPEPDDTSDTRFAQDVWYLESTNCGQEWIDNPPFDNHIDRDPYDSPNNITKWRQGKDNYRTAMDLSAVYDMDHQLHVFFNGIKNDEPDADRDYDDVRLFHWSRNTEKICGEDTIRVQIITSAYWDCKPGKFNLSLSKPSAGVGIAGENYNYLYCLWTQFNQDDIAANGYNNGELYVSVSTNGGASWDVPRNITNSSDTGCVWDECDSDHWASTTTRVDSFLHIQYINDRDPGGIPLNEGDWTYNPVLYYKYPVWAITPFRRIDWEPKEFITPNLFHVHNNGTIEGKEIIISGIGTYTLNVTSVSGPSWITNIIPSSFSILEGGCPQKVTFDIDASSYSEELLVGNINVQSNDGVGNNNVNIPIHVVVSDVYIEPEFFALSNNSFVLNQSNVGNIGHQVDSAGMTFEPEIMPDPIFAPVFDASVIIGTDDLAGSTLVARYMYGKKSMIPMKEHKIDHLPELKVKMVTSQFSPVNPLFPYEWRWWWLTIKMWSQIFYSGEYDSPERFLNRVHIRVYKEPNKPPWWSDEDHSSTNPACFVGMAMDLDCSSDTGTALNTPGYDEQRYLVYQQGFGSGSEPNLFAGLAYFENYGQVPPINGLIFPNEIYVYPDEDYNDDSLFSLMSNYYGFQIIDTAATMRPLDYSCIMVGEHIPEDISDQDTFDMEFLIAGSATGLGGLKTNVSAFMCGNVNRDSTFNLSDPIMLSRYYFGFGREIFKYRADVNADCVINISDAIYMANYYFGKHGYELNCSCLEDWWD